MNFDDSFTTSCLTPNSSHIRIGKVVKHADTRTHRSIHSQREEMFDDSSDRYDFEGKY